MRRLAILTALVVLTAACGSSSPTGPSTSYQTGTDLFPPDTGDDTSPLGHLTVNGAITHDFSIVGPGTVIATISALSSISADENEDASAPIVGFALGTWNGTGCALSITNDRATLGSSITGSASGAGSFCVRIYDVGQLTDTVDYRILVDYPKTVVTQ
jgi:hypothetical protein